MTEPITWALGVAIGKLLLRWAALNDSADALGDARAGFTALRALHAKRAASPVSKAVTAQLERRLAGVTDRTRRDQMRIAVGNVATLFGALSDDDIRAAAQHPGGFPDYLAHGPGKGLLSQTEEAVTPFTRQLMDVGAEVFAELAPRSGRFATGALVHLLVQVDAATVGLSEIHAELVAARAELMMEANRAAKGVEDLHPKVDRLLAATERGGVVMPLGPTDVEDAGTGSSFGRRVGDWDPAELGVHDSITLEDASDLTPYIPRDHDKRLRNILRELREAGSRPQMVLVTGNSCVGKTRTLHEAISAVLPDWQLLAPKNDEDLMRILGSGIPAATVVWLDEFQKRLEPSRHGSDAAKAMLKLLDTADVGPILFAGTLWPKYYDQLIQLPGSGDLGTWTIAELMKRSGDPIAVPEVFSGADIEKVRENGDPRLTLALATAARADLPDHGHKITQVLAGGAQLVARLYPEPNVRPVGAFSPGARAILHAAVDFRRFTALHPIPLWALEGAAAGYLDSSNNRPASSWFNDALEEVTRDAMHEDKLKGGHDLDIHLMGVPALTPVWVASVNGDSIEAYELHDYLFQECLGRRESSPARRSLWQTMVTHADLLDKDQLYRIARAAYHRGLLTPAIGLNRYRTDARPEVLIRLLGLRGDNESVAELHALADEGSIWARQEYARLLAERGDAQAVAELRSRATDGDKPAESEYVRLLTRIGNEESLAELRSRATAGSSSARRELSRLLIDKADDEALAELRARNFRPELITLLSDRDDQEALTALVKDDWEYPSSGWPWWDPPRAWVRAQLRVWAQDDTLQARAARGDPKAVNRRLAVLSARSRTDQEALDELREHADAGSQQARQRLLDALVYRSRTDQAALDEVRERSVGVQNWWLLDALARLGTSDQEALDELREHADAREYGAGRRLEEVLAQRSLVDQGALEELRERAARGKGTTGLAKALEQRCMTDEDALDELRELANAGSREALDRLMMVLAERSVADERALDDMCTFADLRYHHDNRHVHVLARLSATNPKALEKLRERALAGHSQEQDALAKVLVSMEDDASLEELRRMVFLGFGGPQLLTAYRRRSPTRHVVELDTDGNPIYGEDLPPGASVIVRRRAWPIYDNAGDGDEEDDSYDNYADYYAPL